MTKTVEKIAWLDLSYLAHVFLQQPYISFRTDCAELLNRFRKQCLAFIVLDC